MIIALKIIYALVSISMIIIILTQQGRAMGLSGAISGAGESYWGKNKARSMEGTLHKITVGLAIAFFLLSIVINIVQ